MRFRDLSPSAVEQMWDRWKYTIRDMLCEFNDDVFSGCGNVRCNSDEEYCYLMLATKYGCLYIFPLPGNELSFRIFKHRLDAITPALMITQGQTGQDNYVGGFRVRMNLIEKRHALLHKQFQNELETALRTIYREYWLDLIH